MKNYKREFSRSRKQLQLGAIQGLQFRHNGVAKAKGGTWQAEGKV